MNTPEKELSDSLLAACKAAGIESPKYIAQDKDESIYHYNERPVAYHRLHQWDDASTIYKLIDHPPYVTDWQESLLEWVEPQGEPLADVLARHPESFTIETERNDDGEVTAHFVRDHHGDITEMIRPDHIADTNKMMRMEDALAISYRSHMTSGNGYWGRADDYRAGWSDALAWKAMAEKGGSSE